MFTVVVTWTGEFLQNSAQKELSARPLGGEIDWRYTKGQALLEEAMQQQVHQS